jgi:hypothetical protein
MFLNKVFQYQNIIRGGAGNCLRIFLLTASFSMATASNVYANEVSNSEIKASWIYTVIDWIEWKNMPKNSTSTICAVGRDKVYMYLKRIEIGNKNKKNIQNFSVKNKATGDDFRECNILYISESEQEYYMNILEEINGLKGIVTISSISGFARHGGSIEFVIKKKARLIINLKTVKSAQVVIDDELYSWVETID